MFTPDKTKLDQSALARYRNAPNIRAVIERLEGYGSSPKYHPYTGTTPQEYVDWLTEEAMIGYEPGQMDSQIPGRIRQHAKNGIHYLNRLPNDWKFGNDKAMTIRQLLNKARQFAVTARERLDPCFAIAKLEVDPYGEYEATYARFEYVYLGSINAAEEFIARETKTNNSPLYRRKLKAELNSVLEDELIPILQAAIPLLEDMREIIAPAEGIEL